MSDLLKSSGNLSRAIPSRTLTPGVSGFLSGAAAAPSPASPGMQEDTAQKVLGTEPNTGARPEIGLQFLLHIMGQFLKTSLRQRTTLVSSNLANSLASDPHRTAGTLESSLEIPRTICVSGRRLRGTLAVIIFAGKWVEAIMLSERGQAQKEKYCIFLSYVESTS